MCHVLKPISEWEITHKRFPITCSDETVQSQPKWQASYPSHINDCLYLVSSFLDRGHPSVNIHGLKCKVQYTTPALTILLTTTANKSLHANLTDDKTSHHKTVEWSLQL